MTRRKRTSPRRCARTRGVSAERDERGSLVGELGRSTHLVQVGEEVARLADSERKRGNHHRGGKELKSNVRREPGEAFPAEAGGEDGKRDDDGKGESAERSCTSDVFNTRTYCMSRRTHRGR